MRMISKLFFYIRRTLSRGYCSQSSAAVTALWVALSLPLTGYSEKADRTEPTERSQRIEQAKDTGQAELVLTEAGRSLAPIVIFDGAPPFTRAAADELAEYIEATSGSRPKVIEGTPDPLPQHAIWVGYQPVLESVFPATDFNFRYPEEILIVANEHHLVIVGHDQWDPDNMVRQGRRTTTGVQQQYGTINAVYTFMQEFLGVRWLWPGEIGTDILEQERIAFAPFEYRYHPQVRARAGMLRTSSIDGTGGISQDWARYQRLLFDSLTLPGGHAFSTWWDRFHQTHPEFFALQPDGTRGGGKEPFPRAKTVKICKSNPAVWDQWLEDVAAQLRDDPTRNVFNASPNDSWNTGFCVCDDCRAWDHPDGEPRINRWRGVSGSEVAISDRHVTFANILAEKLKEAYPNEDYYVLMMAYGNSRPAPIEAVPADNVIISSVANFILRSNKADRGSSTGQPHREQFSNWAKIAPHITWRPNASNPAGWSYGFPDIPMTAMAKDLKFVTDHGCIGLFIDTIWEHWATQGPLYYLMAQLLWNPQLDPTAIMKDYYQRAYGAAAAEMEAYWTLLEAKRDEYFSADPTGEAWRARPGSRSYHDVYNNEFFEQANGLLEKAQKAVTNNPVIYSERIDYTRVGLDYTRIMLDSLAAVEQWRASGETDKQAEARALANWEEIIRLSNQYPDAMNWRRLEPSGRRTESLHPDGSNAAVRLASD